MRAGKVSNRIVGLVRFSYAGLSGFGKAPKDPGQLAAQLSDPARLERRFHLFEALTLPSLLAQDDAGFEVILLTSEALPAPARARLEAAAARLGAARVVALPPMHHYPATQAAFDRVVRETDTHLVSFRLDDDDAIDRGYVARLRRQAEGLQALVPGRRPFAVGCNRGFFLEIGAGGNRLFDVVEKLPLGVGLAMVARAEMRENIFRRNHRLLPQFFTTFTDAETPAFIRTVHADNDSAPHASGVKEKMGQEAIAKEIAARFPFTAEQLLALRLGG
jgi:hypothetical protein